MCIYNANIHGNNWDWHVLPFINSAVQKSRSFTEWSTEKIIGCSIFVYLFIVQDLICTNLCVTCNIKCMALVLQMFCLQWSLPSLHSIFKKKLKKKVCYLLGLETSKFFYVWRVWLKGISGAPQCFMVCCCSTFYIYQKNCSSCNLDIAQGHITIAVIFWLIVQPQYTENGI